MLVASNDVWFALLDISVIIVEILGDNISTSLSSTLLFNLKYFLLFAVAISYKYNILSR